MATLPGTSSSSLIFSDRQQRVGRGVEDDANLEGRHFPLRLPGNFLKTAKHRPRESGWTAEASLAAMEQLGDV